MDTLLLLVLYFFAFLVVWLGFGVLLAASWGMVWVASQIPGRPGEYLRSPQRRQAGTMIACIILMLALLLSLWLELFARTADTRNQAEFPTPNGLG